MTTPLTLDDMQESIEKIPIKHLILLFDADMLNNHGDAYCISRLRRLLK
jgi:hypothetical protein